MDALQKIAHAGKPFAPGQCLRALVQLAQIRARAKAFLARAGNDQRVRRLRERLERGDELLEFGERGRADFIARRAIERQLDHAVCGLPGERLALKILHAGFFW